jgi:hypothetical protein
LCQIQRWIFSVKNITSYTSAEISSTTDLDLPLASLSEDCFILPTLGEKLKSAAATLNDGVGFFRLRGLDPSRYSSEMNVILYLGISSYVGNRRGRQDELGNMLRKSIYHLLG